MLTPAGARGLPTCRARIGHGGEHRIRSSIRGVSLAVKPTGQVPSRSALDRCCLLSLMSNMDVSERRYRPPPNSGCKVAAMPDVTARMRLRLASVMALA